MSQDLAKAAADRGIRYFLISFVDLFGVLRAKLVPAAAIGQMQRDGAAFAGFATHLDLTPADPDMFAMPDPASQPTAGRTPTAVTTRSRSIRLNGLFCSHWND